MFQGVRPVRDTEAERTGWREREIRYTKGEERVRSPFLLYEETVAMSYRVPGRTIREQREATRRVGQDRHTHKWFFAFRVVMGVGLSAPLTW